MFACLQECLKLCQDETGDEDTSFGVKNGKECWCDRIDENDSKHDAINPYGHLCADTKEGAKSCPGASRMACGSEKWMIRYIKDDADNFGWTFN